MSGQKRQTALRNWNAGFMPASTRNAPKTVFRRSSGKTGWPPWREKIPLRGRGFIVSVQI